MSSKKNKTGSMKWENNKIIWSPKEAYPNRNRQIPKYIKNFSNTKVPTFPVYLYDYMGVIKDDRESITYKDFWIDIKKVRKHMQNVSKYVKASVFAGRTYDIVFDSPLFVKYRGQDFIKGNITIGLRSNDENRNEKSLFFGVKSNIKGTESTEKERDFQSFVFLGIFGGGKEINEVGKTISLTFTNVIIDLDTKEIYHEIDFKKLEIFLKETSGYNDISRRLTVESKIEDKSNKYNSFKWDLSTKVEEDKYNSIVTIQRESNLSLKHNEICNKLAHYFFEKQYNVKKEAYGHIDLLVENYNETIIFEIKTSKSELFKAIGQILYYKKIVENSKNHKENIKTVILFDEKYNLDNDYLSLLNDLNIKIRTISDYI